MRLSVVLIARNQSWNVDRLVASVAREAPDAEIVFVDSLSDDGTAEQAATHPIRVLRLREGWPRTPPAGRYIGTHHTEGDAILFLDGDMELCPGWLGPALALLEADPDVAVVAGEIIDVVPGTAPPSLADRTADTIHEVEHPGGSGLYRRAVLDQVGTFNPHLRSEEEPELCLRIREAGYRLVALDRPVVLHLAPTVETLGSVWARRNRNLYVGQGQVVRYHLGSPLLAQFLRERRYAWEAGVVLVAGALCLVVSVVRGRFGLIGAYTALLGTAVAADAARKRSLRRAVVSLVKRVLIFEGAVRGLLLEPQDPDSYPRDAEVVR